MVRYGQWLHISKVQYRALCGALGDDGGSGRQSEEQVDADAMQVGGVGVGDVGVSEGSPTPPRHTPPHAPQTDPLEHELNRGILGTENIRQLDETTNNTFSPVHSWLAEHDSNDRTPLFVIGRFRLDFDTTSPVT